MRAIKNIAKGPANQTYQGDAGILLSISVPGLPLCYWAKVKQTRFAGGNCPAH